MASPRMRFVPGQRVDLDDGTSVEVVTHQEMLMPGYLAWEARATDGQWLAVSEDPDWLEHRSGSSLQALGLRRGALLGIERLARIRSAPNPVAGYRESAVTGASVDEPVVFLTLEPTLPFSDLFWRRRSPWPPEVVARLVIDLLQAMSESTHAELDPTSVGLSAQGAWLLDPGLSELLRSPRAVPGTLKGGAHWLSYRAPESLEMGPPAHDGLAARYGLGVLAYELLTGAPIYGSEKPIEILDARRSGQPARLSESFPHALATSVHGLFELARSERSEADEVIRALTPLAASDLTWALPLFEAHARPLSFLHILLRRRRATRDF